MGSVFSYYWHGSTAELGSWGRLLAGSDQGLDDDITPTSRLNPFLHWEALADQVYLRVSTKSVLERSEIEETGLRLLH